MITDKDIEEMAEGIAITIIKDMIGLGELRDRISDAVKSHAKALLQSNSQKQFKPCDCTPLDPRCDCGRYDNKQFLPQGLVEEYPCELEDVFINGEEVRFIRTSFEGIWDIFSLVRVNNGEYLIPDPGRKLYNEYMERREQLQRWPSVHLRGKIRYRHLETVQFEFVESETTAVPCKSKGDSRDPFNVRPW
jgi:hypothetical protein